MSDKSSNFMSKLKRAGYYAILPLIGLAIVAKVVFDLFFKKNTLKEALVQDGPKRAAAADAAARADEAKKAADALGKKAGEVKGDEEWQDKRNKF